MESHGESDGEDQGEGHGEGHEAGPAGLGQEWPARAAERPGLGSSILFTAYSPTCLQSHFFLRNPNQSSSINSWSEQKRYSAVALSVGSPVPRGSQRPFQRPSSQNPCAFHTRVPFVAACREPAVLCEAGC